MIPSQILQFPFQYGLAEGTDPKQAPPGTLTRAVNVAWDKHGLLQKRPGTRALSILVGPGGSPMTTADRIFARGDELCVAGDNGLFAYASGQGYWESRGTLANVGLTWSTALDTTAGVQSADMAISSGGIEVRAWVTGDPTTFVPVAGGDLFVEIVDSASGTVLAAPKSIRTGKLEGVRVLIVGTHAVVLTRDNQPAPYDLFAASFDLASPTSAPTTATLESDLATTTLLSGWDACVVGSTFVIAYNRTGPIVALESFTETLVPVASGTMTEASGLIAVSLASDGALIYVAYGQAGATHRVKLGTADATTLAEVTAPNTVETIGAGGSLQAISVIVYDSTRCVVAYSATDSTGPHRITTVRASSVAVADTTTFRTTYNCWHSTKPFLLGGRCYLAGLVTTGTVSTGFTGFSSALFEVEFTDSSALSAPVYAPLRLVGKIDDLTAGRLPIGVPRPDPAVLSSTSVAFPISFLAEANSQFVNWRCGSRRIVAAIGASRSTDWCSSVVFSDEAYLGGSGLSAYDGRSVFDYGFFCAPALTLTTSTSGGHILAGTYLYAAIQEYRSGAGILHRSPASIGASQVTTSSTSTNTAKAIGHNPTNKQTLGTGFAASSRPSHLVMYRTIAAGSVYQRLEYAPAFNVLVDDPSLMTLTYTDAAPDTDVSNGGLNSTYATGLVLPLASRPALYSDPASGIKDDTQPPASTTLFYHADRLWSLAGDEHTFWFSKAFQDDYGIAPGFDFGFRITFPERMIGGASMDEKGIFFSETDIWYLLGTGPAPDGSNNDFGTRGTGAQPSKVQTKTGCIDARSIVSMEDGVMFQGIASNIYMLTRGLEIQWTGRAVQDVCAAYPICTSAVAVERHNEVRFSCMTSDRTASVVLAYNYTEKQWSVFDYGVVIADACMWMDHYVFVTPAGVVYQEDPTTFLDDGAWAAMDVELAEVYAEGPLSYQRVRRAYFKGDRKSSCDVQVRYAVNGSTTYETARAWAAAEMAQVGTAKIGIHVGRQKCDSIRVRITDAPPSSGPLGTGQGINLSAIGFEVAPKQGIDKRAAVARK